MNSLRGSSLWGFDGAWAGRNLVKKNEDIRHNNFIIISQIRLLILQQAHHHHVRDHHNNCSRTTDYVVAGRMNKYRQFLSFVGWVVIDILFFSSHFFIKV